MKKLISLSLLAIVLLLVIENGICFEYTIKLSSPVTLNPIQDNSDLLEDAVAYGIAPLYNFNPSKYSSSGTEGHHFVFASLNTTKALNGLSCEGHFTYFHANVTGSRLDIVPTYNSTFLTPVVADKCGGLSMVRLNNTFLMQIWNSGINFTIVSAHPNVININSDPVQISWEYGAVGYIGSSNTSALPNVVATSALSMHDGRIGIISHAQRASLRTVCTNASIPLSLNTNLKTDNLISYGTNIQSLKLNETHFLTSFISTVGGTKTVKCVKFVVASNCSLTSYLTMNLPFEFKSNNISASRAYDMIYIKNIGPSKGLSTDPGYILCCWANECGITNMGIDKTASVTFATSLDQGVNSISITQFQNTTNYLIAFTSGNHDTKTLQFAVIYIDTPEKMTLSMRDDIAINGKAHQLVMTPVDPNHILVSFVDETTKRVAVRMITMERSDLSSSSSTSTGDKPPVLKELEDGDKALAIGVGIGVALIIVTVGVVILFYIKRKRALKNAPMDLPDDEAHINEIQLESISSMNTGDRSVDKSVDLSVDSSVSQRYKSMDKSVDSEGSPSKKRDRKSNSRLSNNNNNEIDTSSDDDLKGENKNERDFGEYIVPYTELTIEKRIGSGAFGDVYKGEFRKTKVAIKKIASKKLSQHQMSEFKIEAQLMKQILPHPNIVMFRGITLPPDPVCIILEYCKHGSLNKYLRSDAIITNKQKVQLAKDIARGMLHLHTSRKGYEVIHRDLASRNILLSKGMTAAVSDFGMARIKDSEVDSSKTEEVVGPLKWMSPESIKDQKYSVKSDAFSYGVVIYEIVTRRDPWEGVTSVNAGHKVLLGERMIIDEKYSCPAILKRIMDKCWLHEAADRPDFAEILDMLNDKDEREKEKMKERERKLALKEKQKGLDRKESVASDIIYNEANKGSPKHYSAINVKEDDEYAKTPNEDDSESKSDEYHSSDGEGQGEGGEGANGGEGRYKTTDGYDSKNTYGNIEIVDPKLNESNDSSKKSQSESSGDDKKGGKSKDNKAKDKSSSSSSSSSSSESDKE